MKLDRNVLSGNLHIKEGRMITPEDKDMCVISEELASIAGGCGLPNVGTDGEKNGYPYDTPYAAEIFREYETGCRMAAGNDQ